MGLLIPLKKLKALVLAFLVGSSFCRLGKIFTLFNDIGRDLVSSDLGVF